MYTSISGDTLDPVILTSGVSLSRSDREGLTRGPVLVSGTFRSDRRQCYPACRMLRSYCGWLVFVIADSPRWWAVVSCLILGGW